MLIDGLAKHASYVLCPNVNFARLEWVDAVQRGPLSRLLLPAALMHELMQRNPTTATFAQIPRAVPFTLRLLGLLMVKS